MLAQGYRDEGQNFSGPEVVSSLRQRYLTLTEAVPVPDCSSSLVEWDNLTSPDIGYLNVRTRPVEDVESPCLIPPSAGYQRLENQLYRVEIHQGGLLDGATFKWSRDNASIVTSITAINGVDLTVASLGRDAILGFTPGQWVEVIDDEMELKGEPGTLAQIVATNPATLMVTLGSPVAGLDLAQKPRLRRWDSEPTQPVTSGWLPLEDGIEIEFSAGTYRTGNYWLIPARTATGEVEWPPYEIPNRNPIPQPPLGITHHYCRLGISC